MQVQTVRETEFCGERGERRLECLGRSPEKKDETGMKLTRSEWLFGTGRWIEVGLGLLFLSFALRSVANAQAVPTTTVQGTVYQANGQPGAGTVDVSWPAFTTATGQAVAAGRTMVTIPLDGFVSVNLASNVGATPAGLYYTAVYQMSDGTTSTEYWVVPAAAQAALGQVRAQLMPAAQAVQAVSKAYVDQSIALLTGSLLTASGGTLSGPLYLNGDPTQPLQAADKHYVDTTFNMEVPITGGNMTGPLWAPAVNGVQSPVAGSSQTTLQAAMNSAGSNGAVEIPPTYAGTDSFTNPNGVYVSDLRAKGAQQIERSVKEFGAVCDGTTDDTNALQAALNYAQTHGVALTIPQGTCKTRSLNWVGQSIGGLGKQVSALKGFPGQDVLVTATDSKSLLSYTRIHDLTIYVDQSVDISCSAASGRAPAGSCGASRLVERNSVFSPGGSGLTGTVGTGAGWAVGNCAIAMPAALGTGGNGLRVAQIENLEIAATGADPMAALYPGAHSTHTCGLYFAMWPQWSEFRNIDIRGLNTGIAIPALPVTTPAGLNSDSNRWENITIQATHAFTAAAGSNNVLDNVVGMAGNSSATGETPTGLVLDLSGTQQGWTVRNAVVLPAWNAVQPQLTVTAFGGAVTGVTAGLEHGLGFDPYGAQVPLAFSGSCTAAATANVNSDGSIGTVAVTAGGVGCSGTTSASVNVAGTWDTAAPVNLIAGKNMTFFDGNLLKGNGGYTIWNAAQSESYGTQLDGGGGNLPGGGSYAALLANNPVGAAYAVDQFLGADFGAKLQACLGTVSASYGGTCDARNFTGTLSMASNLTISTGNTTVLLPCATISTANQVIVTAGTRNVSLRGCALRGASAASGNQGGTVFLYSGSGAMVQVGDPTYAANTSGFHLDNAVINTTTSGSATAQGLVAYRTQEMDLESLYFLGNQNQTGMTLDGTGNYTGGTFFDNAFSGFQTAVNAVGHQIPNAATTDWLNASTFVRLHIDCPESTGSPIAGTYGINLQQGDGNTFTGGDVEGCSTALHLGPNAQDNTILGLRNEVSTNQVVADAGSAYNSWITGGTMFTGALTDNGTRNSFLDTFHRSFNGLNGDWYGSQKDATVTNHFRIGIGSGNERGLLNRYQTDYGYRWTMGLSDASAGEQFYQILDELNGVYRFSIGQYNNGQSSTNNQTVINSAGTGAIVLNGSNNSGTGGLVLGSGGASETTVATINNAGNAQLNGTLQVGGTSTFTGSTMVKNQADAEIDQFLWAGLTTSQKESFTYKDWNGNSQWYMVKDQNNNWALNSATGGLDSFKAYQSTNSGDTYINASNPTGAVRVNYESGSGTGFNIYGGGSGTLYASFTAANAIKFPGLASSSGLDCLQVDNSGYVSNTGSACGSGSGSNGTVSSGTSGQIAYYTANGTTIGGMSSVPVTTGGTGASTAAGALASLGAEPMSLTGSGVPSAACSSTVNNGTFYTSSALSLYQCSGATGTYQWNAVSGGGSSGVSSVNLLNGAVNVIAGAGISVTSAGSSITIGNTGSGAPAVYYNVLSYGAKADMLPLSGYIGASLTAGSSSAYVGGGNFTSTDAGKYITLAPSGSWTAPFAATGNSPGNTAQIVSVTNGQTIVLSKSSTVTESAYISWGTDNVPAFNACSTAAAAAGGGTCAIPAGNYLLATSPYYLLNGMAQDSGDYGNPGGGSGAAISCTVAAGSLSGCTVTSGGSLYVPNTTLTLNFPQSGYANSGCPAVYSGACGQEFATVTTNGSGQVQNPVTIVYKGFGLASAPIPTVNATGGDGAAATCALTGGTCGTPSITAGGGGYPASSSNFLEVWAFNAPGGTCAGGSGVVGKGTASSNSSGAISSATWTTAPTGCGTTPPRIVFGDSSCWNASTSLFTAQCTNLAPLVPAAIPVQVMLELGVSWFGPAGASQDGVNLRGTWDGTTVDTVTPGIMLTQPAMLGGQMQNTDLRGVTISGGFIGIFDPYNLNRTNIQDVGFSDGIGMLTGAFDLNSQVNNLWFGGYAGFVNGGSWGHRSDFPLGGGGFFDVASVSNIVTEPTGYNSVAAAIDTWFDEEFWHSDFSAYATDMDETCGLPLAASQRQTSHSLSTPQGANTMCYKGISGFGMLNLTRDNRGAGGHPITNITGKYLYRPIYYGSLGPSNLFDASCEGCSQVASDPYRAEPIQEGAIEFNGGSGAQINGVQWSGSQVVQPIYDLSGASYSGTPGAPQGLAWQNIGATSTVNPQAVQNLNIQTSIQNSFGEAIGWNGATGIEGALTFANQPGNGPTPVVAGGLKGDGYQYSSFGLWGNGFTNKLMDFGTNQVNLLVPLFDPYIAPASGSSCLQINSAGLITNTGAPCGGSGGITSFAAPPGSWPSWLVPTVTNAATTPSLAVAASSTGTGNVVLSNGPTFTGNATTFANSAAAEQDVSIQPGTGADQIGAFAWNNYAGTPEWKLRKDSSNYLRLTDMVNSLDREVLYQNGQTLINAGAGANAVLINSSTSSGTGGFYVESGGSSPAAVLSVTASGNTTATGFVSGKFMMGSGTMSMGAGAAAGTSPAIACASGHVCDGVSGAVTLTTGTSTTTGTLATLSFPNTHTNSANCVVDVLQSGVGRVTTASWSESTTALTLTANSALTASTAYQIRYWCGGN